MHFFSYILQVKETLGLWAPTFRCLEPIIVLSAFAFHKSISRAKGISTYLCAGLPSPKGIAPLKAVCSRLFPWSVREEALFNTLTTLHLPSFVEQSFFEVVLLDPVGLKELLLSPIVDSMQTRQVGEILTLVWPLALNHRVWYSAQLSIFNQTSTMGPSTPNLLYVVGSSVARDDVPSRSSLD